MVDKEIFSETRTLVSVFAKVGGSDGAMVQR